jgi:DNA modification methylase
MTIYCADCRDILPHLEPVDLVLTDPPYGLGEKWKGGTWFTRGVYGGDVGWDKEAPQDVVSELVKRPSIIWGGNYFAMPPSRCWLAWFKTNSVPTMADHELAWTSFDRPSKSYSRTCNGWARFHPTEKPIDLMKWCLSFAGGSILDPFMGSGTTLVAAKQLGRKAIGIEIEEKYCEIAVRRLRQEVLVL